jgi:hypothetical protein
MAFSSIEKCKMSICHPSLPVLANNKERERRRKISSGPHWITLTGVLSDIHLFLKNIKGYSSNWYDQFSQRMLCHHTFLTAIPSAV